MLNRVNRRVNAINPAALIIIIDNIGYMTSPTTVCSVGATDSEQN